MPSNDHVGFDTLHTVHGNITEKNISIYLDNFINYWLTIDYHKLTQKIRFPGIEPNRYWDIIPTKIGFSFHSDAST